MVVNIRKQFKAASVNLQHNACVLDTAREALTVLRSYHLQMVRAIDRDLRRKVVRLFYNFNLSCPTSFKNLRQRHHNEK
jgi:hypothetical protein